MKLVEPIAKLVNSIMKLSLHFYDFLLREECARLTFSVGDTIQQFTINIQQDN
jgi:hypothetical protein